MHVRLQALSRRLIVIIVIVLVAVAGAGVAVYHFSRRSIQIPSAVVDAITFPIYVPKNLPTGYTLDKNSFKNVASEGNGVLVFQANDTAGDSLVFSEQSKPTNVNFDQFSAQQLVTPKKMPNVPYPTTVGKTLDKQTTLLSIVTDKTWIIITTQAEFDNQQLHDIAAGISQY